MSAFDFSNLGSSPYQMPQRAPNFGYSPWGFSGYQLPSGYAAPPTGVPFRQNPYLPFGSGFGLGLDYWSSGFGVGPQFPQNLWSRPDAAQSPQSPTPANIQPSTGSANTNGILGPWKGALISGYENGVPGGRLPLGAYTTPPSSGIGAFIPVGWGAE